MNNILYIGDGNSIHDLKWVTYFSLKKNYNTYLIYEKQNLIKPQSKQQLLKNNVKLLAPIYRFSIMNPIKTIQSIIFLKKAIIEHEIDIVHILFATPHALWGLFISSPILITTRGSDVLKVLPELKKQKSSFLFYDRLLFYFFKKAFKKASYVTSTSETQVVQLKKMFNISSKIVRTGVDIHAILESKNILNLPKSLQNKKFILSPRFFRPIYNIVLQIQAIQLLPSSIIDSYIFVFIRGKNYDPNYANEVELKLKELTKTFSLKYIIEDYLDQQTIFSYYSYASLSINTPLSDGTPNSGLESMVAKCPLIIPNINYDKQIFENCTFILEGKNPKELSKLIIKALNNSHEEMLRLGFENVKKYGNRALEMKKIQSFYQNLL